MKAWYLWWVQYNGARWYGPLELTGAGVVQEEFAMRSGNLGALIWRFRWDGRQYVYDPRPAYQVLAAA